MHIFQASESSGCSIDQSVACAWLHTAPMFGNHACMLAQAHAHSDIIIMALQIHVHAGSK